MTAQHSTTGNRGRIGESARAIQVRYVLEGDVPPQQDVTEIRLRLISGASGEQVWSETVSLKDTATSRIRTLRSPMEHLRSRLFEVEIRRATAASVHAATPMDYVLRAKALEKTGKTLERFRQQQALCEEALRRDPDLVPALTCIFFTLDGQLDVDSKIDRERLIRRMDEVTSRAVNLNRGAPDTWTLRSGALMYMGRWDAALEASAKAIQLDPDAAYRLAARAWLMSMAGRPAEAVALVSQAIEVDPPGGWWTIRVGCEAHLLLGQYAQAIAACEKATGQTGEDFDIAYFLAAAYAHTGVVARAGEEAAKIPARIPRLHNRDAQAKQYSTNPEYMRLAEMHWYTGLREASIPER